MSILSCKQTCDLPQDTRTQNSPHTTLFCHTNDIIVPLGNIGHTGAYRQDSIHESECRITAVHHTGLQILCELLCHLCSTFRHLILNEKVGPRADENFPRAHSLAPDNSLRTSYRAQTQVAAWSSTAARTYRHLWFQLRPRWYAEPRQASVSR